MFLIDSKEKNVKRMASNSADKNLIESCLDRFPGAWNQFVDDYIQLIFHAIHQVGFRMRYQLTSDDLEDITSEVFVEILKNDFAFFRSYQGESKLSTYLCTLVHRKAVHEINKRIRYQGANRSLGITEFDTPGIINDITSENVDENGIRDAISRLEIPHGRLIRMFYLEGLSYREISENLGVAINSIGPMLARAKLKLRALLA